MYRYHWFHGCYPVDGRRWGLGRCFIDGLFALILLQSLWNGGIGVVCCGLVVFTLGQWGEIQVSVSQALAMITVTCLAGNQHAQRTIERHSSIHSCANQTQDSGY